MRIPYPVAQVLADVAQDEATAVGTPMAVALVDEEGGLLFFGRMDGSLPVSTELAVSKAFTSAVLRMPTHELGKLAQPGQDLYGIQQTHQGRLVLIGGGIPLRLRGRVAGAIGVSGGTVEQDIRVAQPAATALEEIERWADRIGNAPWFGGWPEIPSVHVLRARLGEEIEKEGYPLSRTGLDVLAGAILLAAFRSRGAEC